MPGFRKCQRFLEKHSLRPIKGECSVSLMVEAKKKRKRVMEKICRHQDDGEGPTSHKMKGRQRCPKCFCGLEGSQSGIDLLKSSLTASFSRCDGAIRAPQTVSDFLENEE